MDKIRNPREAYINIALSFKAFAKRWSQNSTILSNDPWQHHSNFGNFPHFPKVLYQLLPGSSQVDRGRQEQQGAGWWWWRAAAEADEILK